MVDDVALDFPTAAALAGVAIPELRSLVASGEIVTDPNDRVATDAMTAWIERDRNSRRQALGALASGVGTEVFY